MLVKSKVASGLESSRTVGPYAAAAGGQLHGRGRRSAAEPHGHATAYGPTVKRSFAPLNG